MRKRAAVPALPTYRSAFSAGMRPFCPVTDIEGERPSENFNGKGLGRLGSGSICTWKPNRLNDSTKYKVSSENKALVNLVLPLASADTIRARFVRLFEPGTRTEVESGLDKGFIKIDGGEAIDINRSFRSGTLTAELEIGAVGLLIQAARIR